MAMCKIVLFIYFSSRVDEFGTGSLTCAERNIFIGCSSRRFKTSDPPAGAFCCRRVSASPALVQALNNRTVHDELAVAERSAIRTREDAVLDIGEDLKLFPKLTAVSSEYRLRRPLI
jgi:hypothetical protein